MSITENLEDWYMKNKRDLPWRNTNSAYHIWLSEIILQQTRVNQGIDYYNRFLERFPGIEDLAESSLENVLKVWQGLGYYTRARNLHTTAKVIVSEYGGKFPSKYTELLKLKGVGAYTAAAIASIAFKEPVALVDGNVYRVLSRLYGIHTPINTSNGKEVFLKLANELMNADKPDIHNQAVMEFGALVCIPKRPLCGHCVLADICKANFQGITEKLPVKIGRPKTRTRFLHYLFIQYNGVTYIRQRNGKDIWNSLFEFPLIETAEPAGFKDLLSHPSCKQWFGAEPVRSFGKVRKYKHQLTHQTLLCCFHTIKVKCEPAIQHLGYFPVSVNNMDQYAIPRALDRFLEDLKREGML